MYTPGVETTFCRGFHVKELYKKNIRQRPTP